MHILPTTRDPTTHLALSSRNAYLSTKELAVAPVLVQALQIAQKRYTWAVEGSADEEQLSGEELIRVAADRVQREREGQARELGVEVKLDYFEVFDKETFEPVRGVIVPGRELVIAGAVWVGRTRLIDNLLLGWDLS